MANPPSREDVTRRLSDLYGEQDPESLTRILYYLGEEERAYGNTPSPAWRNLIVLYHQENVFRCFANRLIEDTRRAEQDAQFRHDMGLFYANFLQSSEAPFPSTSQQRFDVARLAPTNNAVGISGVGLARTWTVLGPAQQESILNGISGLLSQTQVQNIDNMTRYFNEIGPRYVTVGLAGIVLTYEAWNNLMKWKRGEISGKRCCKNIIDSTFSMTCGVTGAIIFSSAGAAVGGPIGMLLASFVGGYLSSRGAEILVDRLTQSIFDLPQDVALENAYRIFGVEMTASNEEINRAFRQMCLQHNPAAGGRAEDFLDIQLRMGIIKLARGE